MAAAGWRVSCAHLASDERLVHVGDDNAAQCRGCSLHGSCPQRRAGCDPSRRGGNGDQAVRRGAEQQEHGARTGHESDRYMSPTRRARGTALRKPVQRTTLPPLQKQNGSSPSTVGSARGAAQARGGAFSCPHERHNALPEPSALPHHPTAQFRSAGQPPLPASSVTRILPHTTGRHLLLFHRGEPQRPSAGAAARAEP